MRVRRWKREGVGVGRVTGGRPGERKRGGVVGGWVWGWVWRREVGGMIEVERGEEVVRVALIGTWVTLARSCHGEG